MNEFDKTRETFEQHLSTLTAKLDYAEPLGEGVRYALMSGGKRFRPVLFLKAFETFAGEITDYALDFAAAIESLHTYSLVHDDLPCMDNDDFRRGKPTVHKKFGENIAVLVGDALLNLAYELVLSAIFHAPDSLSAALAGAKFAHFGGGSGMICGQIADLAFDEKPRSLSDLTYVYERKTCALIRASVECGAMLGGADKDSLAGLGEFAYAFGFAFQLADDLLDGDKSEGCSVLRILSKTEATALLDDYTNRAINALKAVKSDVTFFANLAETARTRLN